MTAIDVREQIASETTPVTRRCEFSQVERVVVGEYLTNNGKRAVVTESPLNRPGARGGAFGFVEFCNGWFPMFWHADGCQHVVYNHAYKTLQGLAALAVEGSVPDDLYEKHAAYWSQFERREDIWMCQSCKRAPAVSARHCEACIVRGE